MDACRQTYKVERRIPFNSERKRMSTVVQLGDHHYRVHVKGASELIVQGCTSRYNLQTGREEQMTEDIMQSIEEAAFKMADKALRVIAVAYRDLESQDNFNSNSQADHHGVHEFEREELVFLGLFGIMDVLRDGVEESVYKCKKAGITVRMVTGDNKQTAMAIARKCGILNEHKAGQYSVMEGRDFMERIGGVVCSYCKTQKCGCGESSSDSSSKVTNKAIVEVELVERPLGLKELSPIIGKSQLKTSIKTKHLSTLPNNKLAKNPVKVKFNEVNEIFDIADPSDNDRKKLKHADKSSLPSRKVRVDTIKDHDEFNKIIPHLRILARARPIDKYALVVGLKELGHIVAVTGDGTNDVPALSKADVGFAMGKAGTDLAKGAADIIITDDNFNSIVSAVVRGRNIYDSIRKFLMFQLTVNVVAVLGTFIGALVLDHAIITAVQMLWVNLIMDTLASLALATEPPIARDLLKRKPHGRTQSIISQKMIKHIIGQAIFQLAALTIVVWKGPAFFEEIEITFMDMSRDPNVEAIDHQTAIFNTFVMLQIFNFLNCRRLNDEFNIFKNITNSRYFVIVWIIIIVLQVLIVCFAGTTFNLAQWGLGWKSWLVCILIGFLSLPVSMIIKLLKEDHIFFCHRLRRSRSQKEERRRSYLPSE